MSNRTPAQTPKKTGPKPIAPRVRLLRRYRTDAAGCWIWQGHLNRAGYGKFMMTKGESDIHAHRAAYLLMVGPIPDGYHIDHLCRVRACINPAHLEAVTPRENLMRGINQTALNARKTHCPQGHAYDEVNTYWWQGQRGCRTCRKGIPKPPRVFPHGSVTRYRHGCRCDECRGANAKKARDRRARLRKFSAE